MEAIKTVGLTKKYKDVTAVDNLNLSIHEGELFALLGVNGAGKTTTIKMLTCLTKPTCGEAVMLGKSVVSESDEVRKFIGVSPQETAVAPLLTVKENLELMCGVYGFSKEKRKRKTAEIAERFGLTKILKRPAGKLSGGWKRKLSIAMALISEPKILFLDEPMLGLDVIAKSELRETIEMLKGSVTVVLTTHDMEDAEKLSDRVGIMKDGRLLAVNTAEKLKSETGSTSFEEAFLAVVKGENK